MIVVDRLSPEDTRKLHWGRFWLVASGMFWGVSMQMVVYEGGGHPLNQLPNVFWYLGFLLVYVHTWYTKGGRWGPKKFEDMNTYENHKNIVGPIGVLDWLGTTGLTIGLILSGSAIFGIIYASVTVWTALLAWAALGKRMTLIKAVGIALVVGGLILPSIDDNGDAETPNAKLVWWGIIITTAATLFYACEYVWSERAFGMHKIDGTQLCFWSGVWGLIITMLWIVVYTIPNWDTLVTQEIEKVNGRVWLISVIYFLHILNNAMHNWAWFTVCELEGGTSTGLLMGVKAAFLFFGSSVSFCSPEHPEQCITVYKLAATTCVCAGAALYYWPEPNSAVAAKS
jgi:drug/metabolite transporter (DMT)-like permease